MSADDEITRLLKGERISSFEAHVDTPEIPPVAPSPAPEPTPTPAVTPAKPALLPVPATGLAAFKPALNIAKAPQRTPMSIRPTLLLPRANTVTNTVANTQKKPTPAPTEEQSEEVDTTEEEEAEDASDASDEEENTTDEDDVDDEDDEEDEEEDDEEDDIDWGDDEEDEEDDYVESGDMSQQVAEFDHDLMTSILGLLSNDNTMVDYLEVQATVIAFLVDLYKSQEDADDTAAELEMEAGSKVADTYREQARIAHTKAVDDMYDYVRRLNEASHIDVPVREVARKTFIPFRDENRAKWYQNHSAQWSLIVLAAFVTGMCIQHHHDE